MFNKSIVWHIVDASDCWKACGRHGGPCSSVCGVGGYCCRKDYYDCPLAAEAAASNDHHTCVARVQKHSGRSPNSEVYHESVSILTPECDADFVSKTGHGCQDYADYRWCTASGAYGDEWHTSYGTFADWKNPDTGNTAWSCVECGCNDIKMNARRRLLQRRLLTRSDYEASYYYNTDTIDTEF